MKNKFDYYEIVKVESNDPELSKINGLEGAILGISKNDSTKQIAYSVHIFKFASSWFIFEKDLITTGKYSKKEDFHAGESIKVNVDPETGEGKIVEDDEE